MSKNFILLCRLVKLSDKIGVDKMSEALDREIKKKKKEKYENN